MARGPVGTEGRRNMSLAQRIRYAEDGPYTKNPRTEEEKAKISEGVKRFYQKKTKMIRTKNPTHYEDLYNYRHSLDLVFRHIHNSNMPEYNKKIFEKFRREMLLNTGMGYVYKCVWTLFRIFEGVDKKFSQLTESDVLSIYQDIMESQLSSYTKADRVNTIKYFIKWLRDGREPRYFKRMRVKKKLVVQKPFPLEEVKRLLDFCESDEEKAFFATLWEGGFAIGELLNVRMEDVTIKPDVVEILVRSKDRDRVTPLLRKKGRLFPLGSHTYLVKHIEELEKGGKERIWTAVAYEQMRHRLSKLKKKAGLKELNKKVYHAPEKEKRVVMP